MTQTAPRSASWDGRLLFLRANASSADPGSVLSRSLSGDAMAGPNSRGCSLPAPGSSQPRGSFCSLRGHLLNTYSVPGSALGAVEVGVEVESKQGNSKIPVSEEGIREKGLKGCGGGSGRFGLAGGQGGVCEAAEGVQQTCGLGCCLASARSRRELWAPNCTSASGAP